MFKRLCLLAAAAVVLAGCGSDSGTDQTEKTESTAEDTQTASEDPTVKELFAMDTYMTLSAYGENGEAAVEAAADEIERIEKLVSTGDPDSEIAKINTDGTGAVSEDTGYLIERSEELYKETEGLFDITIYPVMKAWGFTDENYRVPEKTELKELLSRMGADKIAYDPSSQEVSVEDGMEIDLGGIAKGYTSSRIMDIYKECGVTSGVVSLGGNVQALGTKPDGSKWRVAVENPDDTGDYIGIVSVADKAVITSGGYERYFEEDGKSYHHIIDPRTGYPAENGLKSVSIVSDDGTLADGLSTSLYIMGKDKAVSFWQEHSDEFDVVLVDDDGNIFVSDGIADDFESDSEFQIIEK